MTIKMAIVISVLIWETIYVLIILFTGRLFVKKINNLIGWIKFITKLPLVFMQRNQPKRKLHDIWALALYIITTITCYGLVITFKEKVNRDISMKGFNTNLLRALLVNSAAVISAFIAFTTIPVFFIHASFFFNIGFSIFLIVRYHYIIGTVVFAVLNTIFSIIFYFYCYKHIKFTGVLLKEATLVMYQYLLGFFAFFLVALSIFGLQIYVTFPLIMKTDDKQTYLLILFMFYYFWTIFNGFYFFVVFSASVISIHLYNKGTKKDTFIPGVKNSLFCAGSVCLGGMLIALISTLRFMVDKNESDRRRRGEARGIAGIILMIILYVIIYLLEEIIAFANEWTFVYMAIYGKNYINSLKESFNKISNPTNKLLVSNLIVDSVTNMFTLCFFMLYMYASGIFDMITGKVSLNTNEVISFTFASIFCLYFLIWFYSLFGSACKTILFVNDEDRQCIREVMPKVSEEFERVEHK